MALSRQLRARAVCVAALAALAAVVLAWPGAAVAADAEDGTTAGRRVLNWETFQALWEALPTEPSKQLKERLGSVFPNPQNKPEYRFVNTCAIRFSDAWNKVAAKLPSLWSPIQQSESFTKDLGWHTNRAYTVKDKDGRNIAVRARELHDILRKDLGAVEDTPWEKISSKHSNAGIVVFYECKFESNPSGNHIDLYQGGVCRGACYNDAQFQCKYRFFPVRSQGESSDGTCTHEGMQGTCMDQVECVEDSNGAKWPAYTPNQCGGDGRAPNVKCCVTK